MKNSKLIELLGALSSEQIKELGRYLKRSSRQKENRKIWLFNYLKKLHPEFPEAKIEKGLVAEKLYKALGVSPKSFPNLQSTLYADIERFFIQMELEEEEIDRNFILLKALKRNKLDRLFFHKVEQIKKQWQAERPKGIKQYYNEYKLDMFCMTHPNYFINPKASIGPENLLEKLDNHYIALKLYWTLCIYGRQRMMVDQSKEENYKHSLLDAVFEYCTSIEKEKSPSIYLLNELVNSYKEKEFGNYDMVKNLFLENIHSFDRTELTDLFKTLQNYCAINYHNGNDPSLIELFELYKLGVTQNLYLEDGYISSDIFRNIIQVGSVIDIEWTEAFFNEYSNYLNEETKEDTIILSEAILNFNKKDYEKVAIKILSAKFQDDIFGLHARALQLQAYYELDDSEDLFFNLVKSFTAFLNRSKTISEITKLNALNFVNFVRKLQLLRYNPSIKLEKLEKEILAEKQLSFRNWLNEKLAELK